MDRFLVRIFQFEIASQCEFGMRAARDLQAALENSDRQSDESFVGATLPKPSVRYRTITVADIPPGSVLSDQTLAEIEAGRFQIPISEQVDVEVAIEDAREDAWASVSPTTDIWFAIQNLLVAAGNLSKLLWGASPSRAAAREGLRQSVGVADDSPLRDRRLRNYFEHFDEKSEDWFTKSEQKNYVGRNIGPASMIQGPNRAERFHHYDPSTGLATFWDDSVSLPQLGAEIQRIFPLARSESMKW